MKENTDEEKYPLRMDIVVNQIIGEGVNLGNGNKIYLLKVSVLFKLVIKAKISSHLFIISSGININTNIRSLWTQ